MRVRLFLLSAFVFATATPRASAPLVCDALATFAFPNAHVDSAQVVAAGAFVQPGRGANANAFATLPAFCRVTATLTPTSDSDIKSEVWLPAAGWNGKFLAVGNGGWAGSISYTALANGLRDGFAVAATDTGHVGGNADFALGHPEKLIDFGYRSIHEMTVHAKAVVEAHYGSAARLAYYNGCSQGGRQGLAAAQQYPADFNGIVAGAAAWNQMRLHGIRTALNLVMNKDADSVIPPAKYPMIHDFVLKGCDARDGVTDGVIENPARCDIDFKALQCTSGDGPGCLTKGQVESAIAMTSPLKDPKTGRVLTDLHLLPGSELGWATLGGPAPLSLSVSGLRNVTFQSRDWDYKTMDLAKDIERAAASDNGATYSGNPDLRPFFNRGGKLIMYHGWQDPQVFALNSVVYYDSVVKTIGQAAADQSLVLYMIPGMNHCSGGPGTDKFDFLGLVQAWVEEKKKPVTTASHQTNGVVDKTRPLCPYPQVAKYRGAGSPNDAANFSCGLDR